MLRLIGILVLIGAIWGLTQPLSKIIVTAGYRPFGIIFWQLAIGAAVLSAVQAVRRRPFRRDRAALGTYLAIALIGTILPNGAGYLAYTRVPSGIMSVLISTVPMMAFALALALRADRFAWPRFLGLSLGLAGIVLIVASATSLGDSVTPLWLLLALVAPALYAGEANFVASRGTAGLGAFQVLQGASALGAVIVLPLALVSGQFIRPEATGHFAILGVNSVISVMAYSMYVWLVGRAGATFAAQCSYLVTGFGVFWAMILLGEHYPAVVWLAMALVLGGLFLVQPRGHDETPEASASEPMPATAPVLPAAPPVAEARAATTEGLDAAPSGSENGAL